jgi:putative ABC transport system permease protein
VESNGLIESRNVASDAETASNARPRLAFVHSVRDRVADVDGVDGVTLSTGLPFSHDGTTARWGTTAMLRDASRALGNADLRAVLPGYFDVLRISLVDGRAFTAADDSVYQNVVMIEDAAAKAAFGDESPIGKSIVTHILRRADQPFTVIGVVRHEQHGSLLGAEHPIIYFPWSAGALEHGDWAIRAHGNPTAIAAAVRDAIQSMPIPFSSNTRVGGPSARHLIVNDIQPLAAFIDSAMGPTRFVVFIVGALAVIAATLTAVGLYSVLASSVRQRTAEIGVRMAFGAEPRDIFSLVVKDGLRLSAIGLFLGALLALASTRVITGLLAGVRATDPLTYIVMSLVFLAIALLATFVPARRAASLDPNVALRVDGA